MTYRADTARLLAFGIATLAAGSGCFFTQTINSEPDAKLRRTSEGPHVRGGALSFSAGSSSDPDGQELTFEWTARTCNADRTECDAQPLTDVTVNGDEFSMTIPRFRQSSSAPPTESVVVTVIVRDSDNAEDQLSEFVDVLNRDPNLDLQVQGFDAPSGGGYPIGTSIDVLAIGDDDDGDEVQYTWRHYPPRGSDPNAASFHEINATTYRLTPDVIGQWMVEVTAIDGVGGSTIQTRSILVQEDAPPCIGATSPQAVDGARYIVDRDAPPRRFAVLNVGDDLDVYPPPRPEDEPQGRARFRWFVATPDTGGALIELHSHDVADYLLDVSAYAPGDAVSMRVEIDDRQGRQVTCADDQATCSIEQDTCLQRVTWEAQVR